VAAASPDASDRDATSGGEGSRSGILIALAVGTGLLGLAVVASLLVAPRVLHAARTSAWAPTAGSSSSASAGSPDPELQALLDRRSDAVLHHDSASYLATQTGDATTPDFPRIGALPWARYRYTETGSVPSGDGVLLVTATLVSELVDDTAPSTHTETFTMHRVDDAWRISSEDVVGGGVQLWDLGALTSYTGAHVLVVGIDVPVSALRPYAAAADAALPGVDAVWGEGWARRTVIVVPKTDSQLARGLGTSMDALTDVAAFAIGDRADAKGPMRVWVNSDSLGSLSDLGREVILRHELAHVASAAPQNTATPTWLAEGFAEFVGYRGSGISLEVEIGDLLRAARKGRTLHSMPSTSELRDPKTIDVAYESASLTCTLVAERDGVAGLVKLYRLTAAGHRSPEENAAAALTTVTGLSPAAFDTLWRSRVAAMAA